MFLPVLAKLSEVGGWQPVVIAVALATGALVPLVLALLPERPSDIGTEPFGAVAGAHIPAPQAPSNPVRLALTTLVAAAHDRNFWLLFATFFICGFTTNGLIGTHLIAMCGDYAIPAVNAAALMAMMGLFDLVGTTASGWLTDRFDSRWLLFCYYALRGLSLLYLPYSGFTFYGLSLFAVFYGLDWIATVPPTLRLTTQSFGDRLAPIVFGWIAAGHQLGAATAAFSGGVLREWLGTYFEALMVAGAAALVAAVLSLWIGRDTHDAAAQPAPAA